MIIIYYIIINNLNFFEFRFEIFLNLIWNYFEHVSKFTYKIKNNNSKFILNKKILFLY
jgi:hypothetical protein